MTAAATSDSTIVVRWTRDPADTTADTIVATVNGLTVASTIVPAPDTSGTLAGLDTGVTYTISVHSITSQSPTLLVSTNPPSGLKALSLDSATISVGWIRTQGDASADTIIAASPGNPPVIVIDPAPDHGPTSIPGLSENNVYSISIHSTAGWTAPLQWMTAERASGIKIYETNDTSSGRPSALILGTHNTHPTSLSGISSADFVLESVPIDSTNPSGISLVSGKRYNPAWNATAIDPDSNYLAGGLDANYRSTNYQAEEARAVGPYGANSYDIPNDNNSGSSSYSRVLISTTADNHLALIEVVPDPLTGYPYSSDTAKDTAGIPYKYITVNVSYQSSPNQPYAARGNASRTSAWPMKKISAH